MHASSTFYEDIVNCAVVFLTLFLDYSNVHCVYVLFKPEGTVNALSQQCAQYEILKFFTTQLMKEKHLFIKQILFFNKN